MLPTSFFRLMSEISDKIYFLSCRPDCQYSFGKKEGCDKRHIHNSGKGRTSAWKWLVLCRQTWSESSQYMPIIRSNIHLYINDNNCARCWYGRNRRVQEGMLHASLKDSLSETDELREIWYTRLQKLTIRLEKTEISHDEKDHKLDRLAHNLSSVIAFIGKLRSLKEITIEVEPDFTALLSINIEISGIITRLFSTIKARFNNESLKINISQKTFEINASTSKPILHLAALGGLSDNDISLTTIEIDRPPIYDVEYLANYISSYNSGYKKEERSEVSPASQFLYRTRLFDEDFEVIPEPEKQVWEEVDIPSEVPGGSSKRVICRTRTLTMYESQPMYDLRSGCVTMEHRKYRYLSEFLPLYIEEDFYHKSESAIEEYQLIPECFRCGIVFSGFEQVVDHVGQCTGRHDTMTRVPSAWDV